MIYSRIIFPLKQRLFWRQVRRRRSAWPAIAASGKEFICPISASSSIKLETSEELSQHIYSSAFEWEEREWLKENINDGKIFYDIGANIGYFTLLAAEWCGNNGHVYAFEPVSHTYSRLTANCELNPSLRNITTLRIALGDIEENKPIHISENGKDAWNSLIGEVLTGSTATEQVEVVPLDKLMEERRLKAPDFMKIDVEGYETNVLIGAQKTIEEYRPGMLVEFTADNLRAAGTSGEELGKLIRSFGYELHTYDPRHRKLNKLISFDFIHKNIIALPE